MKKIFIVLISIMMSMYSYCQDIYIDSVKNSVPTGYLTANKNLSFGVKNILSEVLQDKGFSLSPSKKDCYISVDIFFFDIVQTNTGVSVFKKQNNTTILAIKGTLTKDGKTYIKKVEVSSSEIIVANLIISEDGKPNQQSVSNVIKKACTQLIEKLIQ